MYKEYPKGQAPETLERLADLFRRADAFVVVSAEYNHSIPPGLTNTLDHFLEEYFWRPSAIVCYSAGRFGGVRAAMQLRALLCELGMPSIPSLLPIPEIGKTLDPEGMPLQPWLERSAGRFIDELAWYAQALRRQRTEGTPY
jgi:NAD(P)H-dependent FMN reductase